MFDNRRLGTDQIVSKVSRPLRGRRRDMTVTERALSAPVAHRALAPSSILAAAAGTLDGRCDTRARHTTATDIRGGRPRRETS